MATRPYDLEREGDRMARARRVAAEILIDIAIRDVSTGWSGDLAELETLGAILRRYNVRYVDDMLGEWRYSVVHR